MINQISESKNL